MNKQYVMLFAFLIVIITFLFLFYGNQKRARSITTKKNANATTIHQETVGMNQNLAANQTPNIVRPSAVSIQQQPPPQPRSKNIFVPLSQHAITFTSSNKTIPQLQRIDLATSVPSLFFVSSTTNTSTEITYTYKNNTFVVLSPVKKSKMSYTNTELSNYFKALCFGEDLILYMKPPAPDTPTFRLQFFDSVFPYSMLSVPNVFIRDSVKTETVSKNKKTVTIKNAYSWKPSDVSSLFNAISLSGTIYIDNTLKISQLVTSSTENPTLNTPDFGALDLTSFSSKTATQRTVYADPFDWVSWFRSTKPVRVTFHITNQNDSIVNYDWMLSFDVSSTKMISNVSIQDQSSLNRTPTMDNSNIASCLLRHYLFHVRYTGRVYRTMTIVPNETKMPQKRLSQITLQNNIGDLFLLGTTGYSADQVNKWLAGDKTSTVPEDYFVVIQHDNVIATEFQSDVATFTNTCLTLHKESCFAFLRSLQDNEPVFAITMFVSGMFEKRNLGQHINNITQTSVLEYSLRLLAKCGLFGKNGIGALDRNPTELITTSDGITGLTPEFGNASQYGSDVNVGR